jgi:DNA-binding IclR family transcriptional regulator
MTNETIVKALYYELALFAIRKRRTLANNAIVKAVLAHCKPYWTEWKTQQTLKKVDEQAVKLVEQWDKEDRHHRAQELAAVAEELFPEATVIPVPDAPVPSVMIIREAPATASDAVKALGGELRITYQLERP